jgi:hypothetical protein
VIQKLGSDPRHNPAQEVRCSTAGRPGWTIESLYTHLSALIAAGGRENALQIGALAAITNGQASAAKEAVDKAQAIMERRFENTNEWRAALNDVMGKMMLRAEFDAAHSALTAKAESMVEFIRQKQNTVDSRVQLLEGKASGIGATLTVVLSVFATATALAVGLYQIVHLAASQH